MADSGQTINIKLVKLEGDDAGFKAEPVQAEFTPQTPEPIQNIGATQSGGIAKTISIAAVAKVVYELVKKGYERQRGIVMDDRSRLESLRNYGGANFVANSFGDTFDIFGARRVGESAAYKR